MPKDGTAARDDRVLENIRRVLARGDDLTLARLDRMLGTMAAGARLDAYRLSAEPDIALPADAARLLSLLDPPAGQA